MNPCTAQNLVTPLRLDAGLEEFDFLAGHDRYKKSLSTNSRRLVWAVFRKPKAKFKLIGCLSQLKHLAAAHQLHL